VTRCQTTPTEGSPRRLSNISNVLVGPIVVVALACGLTACSNSPSSTASTTTSQPASYATLVAAGITLLKMNNVSAARQLFQQAIEAQPGEPVAYYDLGVTYQDGGDIKGALKEYVLAGRADPTYVPALYNRATIYRTVNVPLAIYLYQQVIHLQPDSPTAYLGLGLLQVNSKGARVKSQAMSDLRQAVKLEPSLLADVPANLRAAVETVTKK
jgi:tetratricopeptide (TPR) repeat protein